MYGYIYKTTNLINNKIYIGQHKSNRFDSYKGSGLIIKEAFKKYGRHNFKCELIEKCNSQEELNQREIYWINYYKSQENGNYNLTAGGEGIKSPSESTRLKMSKAKSGTKRSEESKIKSSESLKKVIHTQEWVSKISKARKGQKMPEKALTNSLKATTGTKWYHSEKEENRFIPGTQPNGWLEGRLINPFPDPKTIKRDLSKMIQFSTSKTRGTKWYNNGTLEGRFIPGSQPEGWEKGRLDFIKYK